MYNQPNSIKNSPTQSPYNSMLINIFCTTSSSRANALITSGFYFLIKLFPTRCTTWFWVTKIFKEYKIWPLTRHHRSNADWSGKWSPSCFINKNILHNQTNNLKANVHNLSYLVSGWQYLWIIKYKFYIVILDQCKIKRRSKFSLSTYEYNRSQQKICKIKNLS
jgi:hypothetical protein